MVRVLYERDKRCNPHSRAWVQRDRDESQSVSRLQGSLAMKATVLLLACLLSAANAFAQGTVIFDNNVPGVVVSRVFTPHVQNPMYVQYGNGPSDFPPGGTDWSGFLPAGGTEYTALLYAEYGEDDTFGIMVDES